MKIEYLKRKSIFFQPLKIFIENNKEKLMAGDKITIQLKEGGYVGNVIICIEKNNNTFFNTDWNNKESSYFPVRIKATATVLSKLNLYGSFYITHKNGSLTLNIC